MSTVRFRAEAPFFAAVAERQTRYFEGVVEVTPCEFKSDQPHHHYLLFLISYAVVAELADALSSGGSGAIRESSNLSDRTNHQ